MGNFVTQGAVLQCSFGGYYRAFKTKVHESVDGCDDGFYGN